MKGSIPIDRVPLGDGTAERKGDRIEVSYPAPGGPLVLAWSLGPDYVEIALVRAPVNVEYAALPGMLLPEAGPHQALVPTYQGVLFRGTPHPWEQSFSGGGHTKWPMAMGGVPAEGGALLVTQESVAGWYGRVR